MIPPRPPLHKAAALTGHLLAHYFVDATRFARFVSCRVVIPV
ncbi:hypothetical protein [Aeromonas hydrophila]